jgi:hypothetical protein
MIARRLRHAGSGWDNLRFDNDNAALRSRNKTRALRLMPALRVNSGTCRSRFRLVAHLAWCSRSLRNFTTPSSVLRDQSGSRLASDETQWANLPSSGQSASNDRIILVPLARIASATVTLKDLRLLPRLSMTSHSARTSNTAKSFGFVILASTRKLSPSSCLMIPIVTFVTRRASSLDKD